MKNLRKGLMVVLPVLFFTISLQGQSKYGNDSTRCRENLSNMSSFVKIKVYEYAYLPWNYAFHHCPAASKNIYIQGKKILDWQIENASDEQVKEAFIDTLMLMYDKRIENFGEESKVLGKKGVDLLKYRRSAVEEAYGILSLSLEKGGNKTDAAVLATLVTTSSVMFQNGKIEADEMINNYLKSMEAVESQRQNAKTTKAQQSIEQVFAESGAADCEALINIFTPKYEADKADVESLKKITELLKQTKCQESDLFAQASESLYSIEPSAAAGANLAMIFSTREEFEKAQDYYTKAIELESDNELKANYYYQLGAIAMKMKNYPDVKKNCKEAINLKSDYGKAFILIGNAYAAASSSCGESNFQKAAVYLAAVDKFAKAKAVDPTVTEEASQLISRYAGYFPNNEDAFFEGYTDGQSYTVGCWINETTTIRTTKN
ncbi:MAG TPA: hypothetical protein DDX98_08935 [Bacteroidales bacterium]|nr:hypothetical protein [Bacteroidales bacterium]